MADTPTDHMLDTPTDAGSGGTGPGGAGPGGAGPSGEAPPAFTAAEATALLARVTAPWVQDLRLQVVATTPEMCSFHLPFNDRLARDTGIVCGQAIIAAADTAMFVAALAAVGGYVPVTAVDISSRFLRPLGPKGADITVKILKAGRRLIIGRIAVKDVASRGLVAEISMTYAKL